MSRKPLTVGLVALLLGATLLAVAPSGSAGPLVTNITSAADGDVTDSIEPAGAPATDDTNGGEVITIAGTDFGSVAGFQGAEVYIDGVEVDIVASTVGPDTLQVIAPPHAAGLVDIRVVIHRLVAGETVSEDIVVANGYQYLQAPAPSITALSVASSTTNGGGTATISGKNFHRGLLVEIGGVHAVVKRFSFTAPDVTNVEFYIPANEAGALPVKVTNPDGQAVTWTSSFTTIQAPPPSLTSVTPSVGSANGDHPQYRDGFTTDFPMAGYASGRVNLVGGGFVDGAVVYFDGVASPEVQFESSTSLWARWPSHPPGTVGVDVVNPDGQGVSIANSFTFSNTLYPNLANAIFIDHTNVHDSATEGPTSGGTLFFIGGQDIAPGAQVFFGGVPATNLRYFDQAEPLIPGGTPCSNYVTGGSLFGYCIVGNTPPHAAGAVDVLVVNPNGDSTNVRSQLDVTITQFTYKDTFHILEVFPNEDTEHGGKTITLTGVGFVDNSDTAFDYVSKPRILIDDDQDGDPDHEADPDSVVFHGPTVVSFVMPPIAVDVDDLIDHTAACGGPGGAPIVGEFPGLQCHDQLVDLIVINGDGSRSFLRHAFRYTNAAPPVITDLVNPAGTSYVTASSGGVEVETTGSENGANPGGATGRYRLDGSGFATAAKVRILTGDTLSPAELAAGAAGGCNAGGIAHSPANLASTVASNRIDFYPGPQQWSATGLSPPPDPNPRINCAIAVENPSGELTVTQIDPPGAVGLQTGIWTYTDDPPPTLVSYTPTGGVDENGGTVMTVQGTGFRTGIGGGIQTACSLIPLAAGAIMADTGLPASGLPSGVYFLDDDAVLAAPIVYPAASVVVDTTTQLTVVSPPLPAKFAGVPATVAYELVVVNPGCNNSGIAGTANDVYVVDKVAPLWPAILATPNEGDPDPTLSTISPTSGSVLGGRPGAATPYTSILGTGFKDGAIVCIYEDLDSGASRFAPAKEVVFVGSTALNVIMPSWFEAEPVDILVRNPVSPYRGPFGGPPPERYQDCALPGGGAFVGVGDEIWLYNAYTYTVAPSPLVFGAEPVKGQTQGNNEVIIHGANFALGDGQEDDGIAANGVEVDPTSNLELPEVIFQPPGFGTTCVATEVRVIGHDTLIARFPPADPVDADTGLVDAGVTGIDLPGPPGDCVELVTQTAGAAAPSVLGAWITVRNPDELAGTLAVESYFVQRAGPAVLGFMDLAVSAVAQQRLPVASNGGLGFGSEPGIHVWGVGFDRSISALVDGVPAEIDTGMTPVLVSGATVAALREHPLNCNDLLVNPPATSTLTPFSGAGGWEANAEVGGCGGPLTRPYAEDAGRWYARIVPPPGVVGPVSVTVLRSDGQSSTFWAVVDDPGDGTGTGDCTGAGSGAGRDGADTRGCSLGVEYSQAPAPLLNIDPAISTAAPFGTLYPVEGLPPVSLGSGPARGGSEWVRIVGNNFAYGNSEDSRLRVLVGGNEATIHRFIEAPNVAAGGPTRPGLQGDDNVDAFFGASPIDIVYPFWVPQPLLITDDCDPLIGGVEACHTQTLLANTIYVQMPAHPAGTRQPIEVVNPDGQSVTYGGFYYLGTGGDTTDPSVTTVNPASGPQAGGNTVVISGSNFKNTVSAQPTVRFGANDATSVTLLSSSVMTAIVPASTTGAGQVSVTVSNPDGGTTTVPMGYTYTGPTAPSIAAVVPGIGASAGGTVVTIDGSNFEAGATVTFGGTPALSVTVENPGRITARAPAHAPGVVDIVVTNPGGLTSGASGVGIFEFIQSAAPAISSVNPANGPTTGGTSITIKGSGFGVHVNPTVHFGSVVASGVTVTDQATLVVVSPAHAAGLVDIKVTNGDAQSATLPGAFLYQTGTGGVIPTPTPIGTATDLARINAELAGTLKAERQGDDVVLTFNAKDRLPPLAGVYIAMSTSPFKVIADLPSSSAEFQAGRYVVADAPEGAKFLVLGYYDTVGKLAIGADPETSPGFAAVQDRAVSADDDDDPLLPKWAWIVIGIGAALLLLLLIGLVAVLATRGGGKASPAAGRSFDEKWDTGAPDDWLEAGDDADAESGEPQHALHCPRCQTRFTAYGNKPLRTSCPGCGRKGVVR